MEHCHIYACMTCSKKPLEKVYNIVNIMFLRLFVIALDSEGSRKVYVSFVFKEALDSEGLQKPLGSNF